MVNGEVRCEWIDDVFVIGGEYSRHPTFGVSLTMFSMLLLSGHFFLPYLSLQILTGDNRS